MCSRDHEWVRNLLNFGSNTCSQFSKQTGRRLILTPKNQGNRLICKKDKENSKEEVKRGRLNVIRNFLSIYKIFPYFYVGRFFG